MAEKRNKRGRPKMGRPSKITPELQAELIKWLNAGNYIETAAHLAGVSKQTVYAWLKKGQKQSRGQFRDFLDAVKKAEAGAEARLLLLVEKAAAKNWQAAAWRLERKHPERWGRKDTFTGKLDHNHKGKVAHDVRHGLSDDAVAEIRAKVLGIPIASDE